MSKTKEILTLELNSTVGKLRENYESLGLRASGRWGRSLQTVVTDETYGFRGLIKGLDYTNQMVRGRGPNQNQSRGMIAFMYVKILEWMQVKGISDLNPWLVAQKIVREGIKVPNRHNPGTVISDVINDQWLEDINKKIYEGQKQTIQENVIRKFKQIKKQ
jgi:hypothetical protein